MDKFVTACATARLPPPQPEARSLSLRSSLSRSLSCKLRSCSSHSLARAPSCSSRVASDLRAIQVPRQTIHKLQNQVLVRSRRECKEGVKHNQCLDDDKDFELKVQ